jgi:hypothetical protein
MEIKDFLDQSIADIERQSAFHEYLNMSKEDFVEATKQFKEYITKTYVNMDNYKERLLYLAPLLFQVLYEMSQDDEEEDFE